MENAILIASIMGPVYVILGLSILLYAKVWQKVVDKWEKDHFSFFPLAFVMLVLGLIIVRMYNVWEWNIWLIVTLVGWIALIKGAFYMLAPGSWIKATMKLKNQTWIMYLGGLVALVMGALAISCTTCNLTPKAVLRFCRIGFFS